MKKNPETIEENPIDINNILSKWTDFSINTGEDIENLINPTIDLIQEAGEQNDGERTQMGRVAIFDLIELAQAKLRSDKPNKSLTRMFVENNKIHELQEELDNTKKSYTEVNNTWLGLLKFQNFMNPNHNSSSFYFGIDDLINGYIPEIIEDNFDDLSDWTALGFKVRLNR